MQSSNLVPGVVRVRVQPAQGAENSAVVDAPHSQNAKFFALTAEEKK